MKLTTEQYRAKLQRLGLRQVDIAWLMGVRGRHAKRWSAGETPIPQSLCLLLLALEQGKIKPRWLRKHIDRPIPYSDAEWP